MITTEYQKALEKGDIPLRAIVNGRSVYRDGARWRHEDDHKYSINPFLTRCGYEQTEAAFPCL